MPLQASQFALHGLLGHNIDPTGLRVDHGVGAIPISIITTAPLIDDRALSPALVGGSAR
jgi:hypothetical protein